MTLSPVSLLSAAAAAAAAMSVPKTCLQCPQAFLILDIQCRLDVFAKVLTFWH